MSCLLSLMVAAAAPGLAVDPRVACASWTAYMCSAEASVRDLEELTLNSWR